METTQFYLQGFSDVLVNSEYSTVLPDNAYLKINWFPHNDLFVNGIKINTDTIKQEQKDYLAIQIDPATFIVRRPHAKKPIGEIKIDLETADTIIADKYIINKKTNTYETAEKIDILDNGFVAVRPMLTKLGHNKIIKATEQFIARSKTNTFVPQTDYDISQCFLECVRVGDISAAIKFLSFSSTAEKLKSYLGEFEILPWEGSLYIYEQKNHGFTAARRFCAEITEGRITNFNLI